MWPEGNVSPARVATDSGALSVADALALYAPPTVWLLDEPDCPEYDEYVAHHPAGTIYHTLAWRAALADAGVGQPLYLVATQGEQVTGVLPLFETEVGEGRKRLLSLPHTPAVGVLADDAASGWLLQSRAVTLAELRGLDGPAVRVFRPMDTSATPDWVRLPIPDILTQAVSASTPPTHRSILVSELDDALPPAATSARPWLATLVANWPPGTKRPLHTVELDATGNVQAGATWLLDGQDVRVLTWLPADADRQAKTRVLNHIASSAGESGARRMELPVHDGPHDLRGFGQLSAATEISDERPLLSTPPRLA